MAHTKLFGTGNTVSPFTPTTITTPDYFDNDGSPITYAPFRQYQGQATEAYLSRTVDDISSGRIVKNNTLQHILWIPNTAAHSSADWPTTNWNIGIEFDAGNAGIASMSVALYRLNNAGTVFRTGGNGPVVTNFSPTIGTYQTRTNLSWTDVNLDGSRAADDALVWVVTVVQDGGHSDGLFFYSLGWAAGGDDAWVAYNPDLGASPGVAISGTSALTVAGTGTVGIARTVTLAGTSALTAGQTAAVSVDHKVAGTSALTAGQSGVVNVGAANVVHLDGTSALTVAGTGTVGTTGNVALAGTSALTVASSGALSGNKHTQGTSALTAAGTGTVSAAGNVTLDGASALTAAGTGTVSAAANIVLDGTSALTAAGAAALSSVHYLSGTSALTAVGTGLWPAVVTGLTLAQALGQSHTVVTEVWASGGGGFSSPVPWSAGAVRVDDRAAMRRTLEAETPLTLADARVNPNSAEWKVTRKVVMADGQEFSWNVGVFVITSTARTNSGVVKVSGRDRWQRIVAARFTSPQSYSSQLAVNIIRDLVETADYRMPTMTDLTGSTYTHPAVTFERDRDKAVLDLCQAIGAQLIFDGDGVPVLRPVPTLADPVAWSFEEGQGGTLAQVKSTRNREETYNGVVAHSNPNSDTPPVSYLAYDNDPNSPTYWFGPFGQRPRFYSSPALLTTAQCQTAAEKVLAKELGTESAIALVAVPHPGLEGGHAVRVDTEEDGTVKVLVDKFDIPFTAGPQTVETRTGT